MMPRSRALQWLAALLLLASPAVGGQVMPVVHPCAAEAAEHEHHQGHGAGHEQPAEGAQCSCVGTCQVAAVVGTSVTAEISLGTPLRPATSVALPHGAVSHPVDRPIDRLPPPTAPPIA